ncbi:MAG: NAD(P)-dependent oxidoreductase [Lachnospiraceae bacterium]|nr:NAD(P)-dependent oxidoreductase [Lachnospiraceae bacterium]
MIGHAVITGATGTIGMALIRKCIENGTDVTVLVNPDSPRLERLPLDPHVKIVKCALVGLAEFDASSVPKDADCAMFHLAWAGTFGGARDDRALQERNAAYADDAVRLAAKLGCRTFVGAGSQAEYGRVSGTLAPDTPCAPENEYGRAKLAASEHTRNLCRDLGIRHIWPRILSIYGPYDGQRTMIMSLISSLLDGKKPALTKGEQMWDYLYADDAASALLLLAESGTDGGIYPIGSGTARPLKEYIETVRDIIDPQIPLGFGEVPYAENQVMHLCADISKLKEDTGFTPRVSFLEGARRTVDFVRAERAAGKMQTG